MFICLFCTQIVPKRSPLQSANNEINDILPPVSLTVFDLLKNEWLEDHKTRMRDDAAIDLNFSLHNQL